MEEAKKQNEIMQTFEIVVLCVSTEETVCWMGADKMITDIRGAYYYEVMCGRTGPAAAEDEDWRRHPFLQIL